MKNSVSVGVYLVRKIRQALACVIALCVGLAATPVSYDSSPFVTKSRNKFMLNGHEYRALGFNSYYLDVGNWNRSDAEIKSVFDTAKAKGMTVFRATDIIYDFNISDINLQFSETVWAHMDHVLNIAQAEGIKVILDLSNIPHTLDNFSPPVDFMNPVNYSLYDRLYSFVPNRVNTINGLQYKNDPTIIGYVISGEPVLFGNQYDANGNQIVTEFGSRDANNYEQMITHAATILKQNDPNHLVSAGGFNHFEAGTQIDNTGHHYWETVWSMPNIDYASMHVYPSNPLPVPSGEWVNLPSYKSFADSVSKPFMVEEWGLDQSQTTDPIEQQSYFNYAFETTYESGEPIMILWSWHTGTNYDIFPGQSANQDLLVQIISNYGSEWETPPSDAPPGIVPNGCYKIVELESGKVMDVYNNSNSNGGNVELYTYGAGNNQKWIITHLGNNVYKMINVRSGLALDVAGASKVAGANVQQYKSNNGSNQQWRLQPTAGGYYSILSVNSGLVLDVSGASTADGANVQQWYNYGTSNQQWSFQAP
jgi:Ricin-type beta-trefoil lectin domain-like/Cellulase (glycosyl hydrolase family 5)